MIFNNFFWQHFKNMRKEAKRDKSSFAEMCRSVCIALTYKILIINNKFGIFCKWEELMLQYFWKRTKCNRSIIFSMKNLRLYSKSLSFHRWKLSGHSCFKFEKINCITIQFDNNADLNYNAIIKFIWINLMNLNSLSEIHLFY